MRERWRKPICAKRACSDEDAPLSALASPSPATTTTTDAGADAGFLALLLAGFALLALGSLGFVTVAPNRLLSGTPLPLWTAVGTGGTVAIGLPLLALLALGLLRDIPGRQLLIAIAAGGLLVAATAAAGWAASAHAKDAGALTRVALGPGFWCTATAGFLALADAVGRMRHGIAKALPVLAVGIALAMLAGSGALSELSIAREYAVRRDTYLHELGRHLQLTAAGLALAVPCGAAIGRLAYRDPRRAGPAFAVLDIVQTIPSLALFALLIGPLAALVTLVPVLGDAGVSGIGAFPAILALGIYGLLPVARGVHAGLASVPVDVVEAARGMGMSGRQILLHTLMPLAAPALVQTLRVTIVQLIGLTTLAALIGAGGLGTFIFQGLGQTASDLVLLGALSAIGLALIADLALRALARLAWRRGSKGGAA
ncbi:MAG: binding-protein-dependent transport system inner rane component [Xanthobacteraceae bacterium]|jgi:osmoprotectant transport system permease protein|nr:binding-protein-dependent transport system inner rane component [Xanthobacteraceae bacterium]